MARKPVDRTPRFGVCEHGAIASMEGLKNVAGISATDYPKTDAMGSSHVHQSRRVNV